MDGDQVVDALESLIVGLEEDMNRDRMAVHRAHAIRELRVAGVPYQDIIARGEHPTVLELLGENLALVASLGHRLRVASAKTLRAEGLTLGEIASQLGVSRQRIAELLRSPG